MTNDRAALAKRLREIAQQDAYSWCHKEAYISDALFTAADELDRPVARDDVIEECARVCDDYERDGRLVQTYAVETADELAARIRALKRVQSNA